ncbi:MAG: hypothetical protein HKN20_10100 [Gemmatimonadetes bacterium]|nr:hypothetical protein [Gemmatimonadota bacterium]
MTIMIALSLVVFLGCSKEQAEEMAANAKEKAGEAAEAAKEAGYDVGENAKELAGDAVEGAKNAATDAIEGTKDAAEKTMTDAKNMAESAGDRVAGAADAAAEKVAGVIPAGMHEVGCGKCMYNMAGVTGCDAAVKVDGKPMLITGNTIDCHQYGLCSGTKVAKVEGKVVGNQFAATKVTIN